MKFNLCLILPLLLALLSSAGLHAKPPGDHRRVFKKEYTETFDVNEHGTVQLNNRFGEIEVETWNRNQVEINVLISVSAQDAATADKSFDRITINFASGNNLASAETSVEAIKKGSFWDSFFGDGIIVHNRGLSNEVKIYYRVKMPAAARLETTAKYCDVQLPNLSGTNHINVSYGNLYAGRLTGENSVKISYGSMHAEELGQRSSLYLRYGESTIRKADYLRYNGRYSDSEIEEVDILIVDAGYEDMEVERANRIEAEGNYCDYEIGTVGELTFLSSYSEYDIETVRKSIKGKSRYGDVTVDALGSNFKLVDIEASYADVLVIPPGGGGYEVDLQTSYGDISLNQKDKLDYIRSGSRERIRGLVRGAGSGTITVSVSYGEISLD